MSEPTKLSELIDIRRKTMDPRLIPDESYHYYSMPSFDETGLPEVTQGREIDSAKFLVEAGDILVSKLNPRIKRVWRVDSDDSYRAISSTEFVDVVPKEKENREFLYHLLMSDEVYGHLQRSAVGTTNSHVRFKPDLLLRIALPALPPPPGWARIAEILSTVDEAIEQTEALIAKTQQIKAGLMHDIFTRGVTPDGQLRLPREEASQLYKESPLGWIPKDWDVGTIQSVTTLCIDCPHSTPVLAQEGYLMARTSEIRNGRIDLVRSPHVPAAEFKSRTLRGRPLAGDIVFTREAPVGEAFVVPDGVEICLGQRMMLIRPRTSDCPPEFLLYQLYSEGVRRRIDRMVGGTTNPHLNVQDVRAFSIGLPQMGEQKAISARLSALENSMQDSEMELAKLRSVKSGLMSDLLTGQVRVLPPCTPEVVPSV